MQPDIRSRDLESLLTLYNQEIEKLKERLLNGETWENLKPTRRNITELAIAIQKSYGYNVALGTTINKINPGISSHADQNTEVAE